MIPGIMEDILELVSVLSLPVGLGQLVGMAFWLCLATTQNVWQRPFLFKWVKRSTLE